jgi:L-threonylcarbamoyladenylate synthase
MILDGTARRDRAGRAGARARRLVAFPTETVYGLGADAGSDGRGRHLRRQGPAQRPPADRPRADAPRRRAFAARVPPVAQRLMDAFWPGPLTLILPRRPDVGAGRRRRPGTRSACAARRIPSPTPAAGLRQATPPVSAWPAQRQPLRPRQPHHRAHVHPSSATTCWCSMAAPLPVGIESAIVDCTRGLPVLLRPAR